MEHKASSSGKPKTADLDIPLHTIGFEFEELSAQKVSGNLHLTQKCCQVNSSFCFLYFFCFL